jgi:hypothetical protein
MAVKKSRQRAPAQDGELVRLTALQLAIVASIESGPKREQYGSRILEERQMLVSRWGAPGPEGGNRRRFYKVTPEAAKAARMVGTVLANRLGISARKKR